MFKTIDVSLLRSGACRATLVLSITACTGETVELGEVSRDLSPSASTCPDAARLAESVVIEDQAQLEQLEGCEEIEGNLYVRPFAGADFSPLARLRRVGGALELGRDSLGNREATAEELEEILDREEAVLAAGWLTSLAGFENLESAASLKLNGLSASNLEPLSNLTTLTNGVLELRRCTGLRDLMDLERLSVDELIVSCTDLESLAGPRFSAHMGSVRVSGPRLVDLGGFAPVSVNELSIEDTGLEHLDALSELADATRIRIVGNAALVNLDALDRLETTTYLAIEQNPQLEQVPGFRLLHELSQLRIADNASLTNVPSLPNLGLADRFPGLGTRVTPNAIDVLRNPALVDLVVPTGLPGLGYLVIDDNAGLVSVDLSNLQSADGLTISGNPQLETLNLGQLETVDELRVFDNPLLPLEPFDDLLTFRRTVQPGPLDPGQE